MSDVDDLCTMLIRANIKWVKQNAQMVDEPRSSFLVYIEQPPGRLNAHRLYCIFDFDAQGNLLNIQMNN